jgi:hypothetical protein
MPPAQSPWPLERDMAAFYGDPDPDRDGRANAAWEAANLIHVLVRWPMWIRLDDGVHPVTRLRVHRLVARSLEKVLDALKEQFPSETQINSLGLQWTAGAYNFRTKRGLQTRSTHAYGAAIDLDPNRNPLGRRWAPGMMDPRVVTAFKGEGWVWGGDFKSRPDCMHFQAAR